MSYLHSIGLVCLCIITFNLARKISVMFYKHVFAPIVKKIDIQDLGRWAVITGASDGLGKAYARALAKAGVHVILIARNKEKLEGVANQIELEFNVRSKVIVADFTDDTKEAYHSIEKVLWNYEIGMLVNNVGMSNCYPEYFLNVANGEDFYGDMIKCNIVSVTKMTRIVLPKMIERKKGVIINISSIAATVPSPLLAVYAATKAYTEKFSADLLIEYGSEGIFIQCLIPGFVATKMSKIKHSSWMAPSPDDFVKSAMKSIGVVPHTTGYIPHSIMLCIINFLDEYVPPLLTSLMVKTMTNIRRRALQKSEG